MTDTNSGNNPSFLTANSPLAGILGALPAVATAAVIVNTVAPGTVDFDSLGVTLLPYQREGVEYALARRRVYLGDEMGLGKTYQAAAAIVLDQAYPALVVCPPSLTLNWRNEFRRIAPGVRVVVLSGTKPVMPEAADVYVIGDAVLAKWVGAVKVANASGNGTHYEARGILAKKMNLQALVVDEAHRHKSYTAQRAIAAMTIANTLPERGLRIVMSGTAIVNRPSELATQIRIAGVDRTFGGWFAFLERYCPKIDRFGTRGAQHLAELHERMTGSFYLRRLRANVLELPGKGRLTVATEMRGKAARDYLRAQDDLIAYIRGEKGNKAALTASKAEALVMLSTLRRLVGAAKIEAVIEYVQDLVDEGEQVFVAAWHADVTNAIAAAFANHGAVTITGSDTTQDKQAAVEAFQAGTARVLVGNLVAAGVGFTLTAARHIVVAELPWEVNSLNQVEDRLDRIGQTRKVISHIMLGANGIPTVDERIMSLIQDKAAVTGMVMDGVAHSVLSDESVMQGLLDSYK